MSRNVVVESTRNGGEEDGVMDCIWLERREWLELKFKCWNCTKRIRVSFYSSELGVFWSNWRFIWSFKVYIESKSKYIDKELHSSTRFWEIQHLFVRHRHSTATGWCWSKCHLKWLINRFHKVQQWIENEIRYSECFDLLLFVDFWNEPLQCSWGGHSIVASTAIEFTCLVSGSTRLDINLILIHLSGRWKCLLISGHVLQFQYSLNSDSWVCAMGWWFLASFQL